MVQRPFCAGEGELPLQQAAGVNQAPAKAHQADFVPPLEEPFPAGLGQTDGDAGAGHVAVAVDVQVEAVEGQPQILGRCLEDAPVGLMGEDPVQLFQPARSCTGRGPPRGSSRRTGGQRAVGGRGWQGRLPGQRDGGRRWDPTRQNSRRGHRRRAGPLPRPRRRRGRRCSDPGS